MKQAYKDRNAVGNGGRGVFPATERKNRSQIKLHYADNDYKSSAELRRTQGKQFVSPDALIFDKEKFLKKAVSGAAFFEDSLEKSNVYLLDNANNIPPEPYTKGPQTGKAGSTLSRKMP